MNVDGNQYPKPADLTEDQKRALVNYALLVIGSDCRAIRRQNGAEQSFLADVQARVEALTPRYKDYL